MNTAKIATASMIGVLSLISTIATAAPVDLSTWQAEGATANWVVAPDNTSVEQTTTLSTPTVFHNNMNSQGQALAGEITVETTSDDDFIGFVLGYDAGDLSNASADYLLIDWKQKDQTFSGLGDSLAGLSISRVTGSTTSNAEFWQHSGAVQELQRATTLGSTGWNDNETYTFDLTFTSSFVEVKVNGLTELSIMGTFEDGAFGFYNYSQRDVLYAGITQAVVPDPSAVPVPAAAWLFGSGLLSFAGIRRRKKS